MDTGEFDGRRLYAWLWLDYRLRLWTLTPASRGISAAGNHLLIVLFICILLYDCSTLGRFHFHVTNVCRLFTITKIMFLSSGTGENSGDALWP